jgi:TPR repeat protein
MQVFPTFRALVRIFCWGLWVAGAIGAVIVGSAMSSRLLGISCSKNEYEAALQSTEADKIAYFSNHCPQDQQLSLLNRAAELGNIYAQLHLLSAYQGQGGVERDLEKSRYWFHKLEQDLQSLEDEEKDNRAFYKMHEMGLISSELAEEFESGVLVPKDLSRAFGLYLQAAEQGYSGAFEPLAKMYERGEGTKRNLTKAFEFYLKNAEFTKSSDDYKKVADIYLEGGGGDRNLRGGIQAASPGR